MEFATSMHYYQFALSGAYISSDANSSADCSSHLNVRESWLCNPPTQDNAASVSMLGLFSSTMIKCNDVICQYNGRCLSTRDAMQLHDKSYLMRIGEQCYIDASQSHHCLARYINDCRNASGYNSRFDKSLHEKCAWVIATRDIEPNEEIFADYGKWYWAGAHQEGVVPIRLSVTDLAILKNII